MNKPLRHCLIVLGLLALVPSLARPQAKQANEVAGTTFPTSFDPVWYRPEKLGFSLKAYRSSGRLTLDQKGLSFQAGKDLLRIPYERIRSVSQEMISSAMGTYVQDWIAVRFMAEDGSVQVAMFRGGRSLGHSTDTGLIFDTIRKAFGAARQVAGASLSTLDRVQRWVETAEAAESGQDPGLTPEQLQEGIENATKEIEAYVADRPEDVRALILSARIARFRRIQEPVVTEGAKTEEQLARIQQETREQFDVFQGRLDKALALQPQNAEAYYWKARLYGVRSPVVREGRLARAHLNLEQATHCARKAVELSPETTAYREALAVFLEADQKYDEAAEVMRSVAGGRHIIHLLLLDRKAVPIPEGAVFSPVMAQALAERPWIRDYGYPTLRVQSYVVRMPASEVTAFYRQRWPGFQFFEMKSEKNEDGEIRMYGQLLRGPSDALRPAKSKREIPKEQFTAEGPFLALMEFRMKPGIKPPSTLKEYASVPAGGVFCVLSVINGRAVDSP